MQVTDDRQLYLMLGEIKAQLAEMKETQRKTEERTSRMEKKINFAAGAVALFIFLFQATWAYLSRKIT